MLEPLEFLLSVHYSTSLCNVQPSWYSISFLSDDTLIYLSFYPKRASSAFSTIESCIRDVFSWMTLSKLSFNSNKTEYLLFNLNNVNLPSNIIYLSSNTISPNDSAKNLGVIFQTVIYVHNFINKHLSFIVKSCFLRLRDVRRIRPRISKTAAITLTNAFVHSRLDFGNSLFCTHHYKFFSFFLLNSNSQIFILTSNILSY